MPCKLMLSVVGLLLAAGSISAAEKHAACTDPKKCGPDFMTQGEYTGTFGENQKLGAQVIALGDGKFDAVLYTGGLPGAGWDGKTKTSLTSSTQDGVTQFSGQKFKGRISNGALMLTASDGTTTNLKRVERKSPTLGAKAPEGAVILFDGKNTDEWVNGKLEEGHLLGVGTRTKRKFKNYTLHLEFRTPFMPTARGQARANSGMYLNDQYEFQILDSFGLKGENNECGGLYQIARPAVNMCLPPLSWQTYDVEFRKAQFDDAGKKIKPAVTTIRLNGVVIHDHFEIPHLTPGGGLNDEGQAGSLYLQNHGNPVRFRNIWIVEHE